MRPAVCDGSCHQRSRDRVSFEWQALFGREYFAELASLTGPAGAKQIIAAHAAAVEGVPFPHGMTDIDMLDNTNSYSVPVRLSRPGRLQGYDTVLEYTRII